MSSTFGPGELVVVGFDEPRVPASVRTALVDVFEGGAVTLIDAVVVRREAGGEVIVLEGETLVEHVDPGLVDPDGLGLIGSEDIDDLAESLEPETSLLVLLVEHTWARALTSAIDQAGAVHRATERIPAGFLDEILSLAQSPE